MFEAFSLASQIEFRGSPRPGLDLIPLGDVEQNSQSSTMPPLTVECFLTLRMIGDTSNPRHTLNYEMEDPNGRSWPLQYATGEFLVSVPQPLDQMIGREPKEIQAQAILLGPGDISSVLLPIRLVFYMPGEHRVCAVIDGIRERYAAVHVTHVREDSDV